MMAIDTVMKHIPLGRPSPAITGYDRRLLYPIPRIEQRTELKLSDPLPFHGVDIWNVYELSWLDSRGKPQVAIAEISFPCDAPHIIESKSLKLYFVGLNQMRYESAEVVRKLLIDDLSQVAGDMVGVTLMSLPNKLFPEKLQTLAENFDARCIDDIEVDITHYRLQPEALKVENESVTETLYSNLLRSNCPVTNQPDWGSLFIRYEGNRINREGLLKYIISFREHQEFHEHCVERIFVDIMQYCRPEMLTVCGRYLRRGGMDINPFRSNFEEPYKNIRTIRQ